MDASFIFVLFYGICTVYGLLVYTASAYKGSSLKIAKDYSIRPKVSVMISAYNEGASVYETIRTIKASHYPAELIEVVAFDDCSKDDTFTWMEKAAADFSDVIVHKNPSNRGKAPTLAIASGHTTGEIIICTDADTVFDPGAISELVCCFADARLGAVGGSIGILNVNESLLTQMQTVLYGTAYWLFKPSENIIHATQCLGGPLVAFRRELYLDIVPDVLSRNFFGEPLHNGEDRFITQCVLLRGWRTYTNLNAKCWVGTPVRWDNYFKQQLRWRRSALGQWFYTLFHLPQYLSRAGPTATIGSGLPIMNNLVWAAIVVWMCMTGTLLQSLVMMLVIKFILLPIMVYFFNRLISKVDASQRVKNPVAVGFYITVWFVVSVCVVLPWAFFTLDDGGWVTRQDGANGNA